MGWRTIVSWTMDRHATIGQAFADEMQADENALVSLGTNTNSRGTPIYWNRLHMLCRQQATSTGNLRALR